MGNWVSLPPFPSPPCLPQLTQPDPFVCPGSPCLTGVGAPYSTPPSPPPTCLLACGRDGEEELDQVVMCGEAPELKLQAGVLAGAGVTIAAVVISSLCGRDPWVSSCCDVTGV